jgi:translation elongation factor EF-G
MMNEDTFNMEVRKFLKKVGVTSQREIEKAVREAMQAGSLAGNKTLKARMKLEVEGVHLDLVIEDDIALS